MNSNYLNVSSDLESKDAREFPDLKITRAPQIKVRQMPVMSANMVYLRLGLRDGLKVGSDQRTKIDYSAQDEHAHGQTSIKQEPR